MSSLDALAAALDELEADEPARKLKIDAVFGDRPTVLDSIRRARVERKRSIGRIAEVLSKEGDAISEGAVRNWLRSQGLK